MLLEDNMKGIKEKKYTFPFVELKYFKIQNPNT